MAAQVSKIGRVSEEGEQFPLRVGCWNIANAARDEIHNPLGSRISLIIERINLNPVDVLVLLEANRPSQGRSFTSIAAEIESATGLRYIGVKYLNATSNAFGKAVFVRSDVAFVSAFEQIWTGIESCNPLSTSETVSKVVATGNHFGNDIVKLMVHPVINGFIVRDKMVNVGIVHFPMALPDRLQVAEWVRNVHPYHVDIWMGDWNTFPDDGGPEMIQKVEFSYTKRNCEEMTFRAFPHDLIAKPLDFVCIDPSEVVEVKDDCKMVRFSSCIDHVFSRWNVKCDVHVDDITDASDHALIVSSLQL